MNALAEKMKDAGVDTIGARLTATCVEAIRRHPENVTDAWRFVGATFGHEFIRGIMADMQPKGQTIEPQFHPAPSSPSPRNNTIASPAPAPYKPRVIPPERLEKRRELQQIVRIQFGYKLGDGTDIAQLGVHELDVVDRDGAMVRAVKARIGVLTNEDRFKKVYEVMTQKQFNEVLDQVRRHPIKGDPEMISRRALFGLSVGAAATAALPAQAKSGDEFVREVTASFMPQNMGYFEFNKGRIYHIPCRPGCAHTQKWLDLNKVHYFQSPPEVDISFEPLPDEIA